MERGKRRDWIIHLVRVRFTFSGRRGHALSPPWIFRKLDYQKGRFEWVCANDEPGRDRPLWVRDPREPVDRHLSKHAAAVRHVRTGRQNYEMRKVS